MPCSSADVSEESQSSGSKSRPSKKPTWNRQQLFDSCWFFFLAYSSIPKIEAMWSSETSVGFNRITRYYNPEDRSRLSESQKQQSYSSLNLCYWKWSTSQSQSHFMTDSQSVRLSWCRAPSWAHDQVFTCILIESYCPVYMGRPLWREVGSVICRS
jgi:hypothetical protein